jgi:cell division protein FtsB
MILKKGKVINKLFVVMFTLAPLVAMFYFKAFLLDKLFSSFYFLNKQDEKVLELSTTERENYEILKIENQILEDENRKLRDEFSVGIIDEPKAPVFMLLGENLLYGDFFVSFPKNKSAYKGMNIFTTGNVVVGQVEEMYASSLKIGRLGQTKPFIGTDLQTEESVELRSLSNGLYFGNVSGGSKVEVGDLIVLKGYPKAVVGEVVEVNKTNTSLSNVLVRAPYNTFSKEIFYVVR